MEKDKSIDGLKSRSEKAVLKSKTSKSISKAPKSASKTSKPTPKKSTSKSKTSAASPKTTQKSTTEVRTAAIEDFLKPVQAFNFDEDTKKLTAADPISTSNLKKPKKSKKLKKPMSKKKKIILGIIITLLSIILVAGIIFILWGNDIIAKITGGQGNVFDLIFAEETYETLATDENGRTNILAFGTSGYDMEGTEGDGTHDGAQLTDSIMVISLDQETGDLAMLSLPRDLYVAPTCTSTGKINEVYWCNDQDGTTEAAGAEALMAKVGDILGIEIQYYAHLNWSSLVQIVDTLGGITINLDEDVEDYYYTGAVYEAGVDYTIDGAAALGLARARHGTTSGDFSRGASQQKILIGIKNRITEKYLTISDMLSLASTLGDNLRTNFSIDEMRSAAHLLSAFDFDNMRQVSLLDPTAYLTTGIINGISYVLPITGAGNYYAIQEYVAKMFSSDPKVYEEPSILVLNGTETAGLAAAEQATLKEEGYTYVFIGDAPTSDYSANYTLYSLNDDKPDSKEHLEEKYHTSALTLSDLPAGIETDYDFVLILGGEDEENSEE